MPIRTESVAPDRVLEWSTTEELPVLTSYCADPFCAPSTLCDRCRLDNRMPCDCCGRPATVIDDGLPWCVQCLAVAMVEFSPETVAFVGQLVARSAVRS